MKCIYTHNSFEISIRAIYSMYITVDQPGDLYRYDTDNGCLYNFQTVTVTQDGNQKIFFLWYIRIEL